MKNMFQVVFNFILMHKFSMEIGSLGVLGTVVPELTAADHGLKILIGIVTLVLIIRKELRERKKNKQKAEF